MAASNAVWGIDLGQCALKALKVRAGDDKVEVVDHVYIEHSKILSQPDVDKQALISESIRKFLDKHDLSRERLVVGVPGQHTLARFTKLPPVDKKAKIPELVKYEAQQQIPFDMDEVIWDYQAFSEGEGTETEVGIFAMRRELMGEHLRFLSDLNLEPALVQAAPLALYNALHYEGLVGHETVAILDIGAQNTDLLIVDGGSLWARNIPIGGNNFSEALLKTFKLSFNKAENLKRSAGSSKYARQIFQAMRPVFADLVAEIQRSIGFYTSSRRGVKIAHLIAMGNAFRMPGMPKFIQQNLGMEVIRPSVFSKLSVSEAANAPQLMDQLLSFGVAYGLALQGLGLARITSNLLPPEIAKQIIWRKKSPWFYGAAACLVLAAVVVWGKNLADQQAIAAAAGPSGPKALAQQVIQTGQTLNNELSSVQSEDQAQLAKAEEMQKLQAHKVVWPRLLDMIHSALPAPDTELAQAQAEGPAAYKALIASNPSKYDRTNRKQVFIRVLQSQYSPDVYASYNAARGGSGGAAFMAGGDEQAAPEGLRPGFVITIVGQTPFAGGDQARGPAFVNGTVVGNLYKAGQGRKELYFDKIHLVRCDPVASSRSGGGGMGAMAPYRHTGPGPGGGGMGEAGMATIASDSQNKDPLTGESTSNDWEFEIIFVAVLGEKSAEVPSADPAVPQPEAVPGRGVEERFDFTRG